MSVSNIKIDTNLFFNNMFLCESNSYCVSTALDNYRDSINEQIATLSERLDGPKYLQTIKVIEPQLCKKKEKLETRLFRLKTETTSYCSELRGWQEQRKLKRFEF